MRRHVVEGRVVVALHDEQQGRVATVGEREWALLSHADGTRTLDGIVAAARRVGPPVSHANAEAFFEQLASAGMLEQGPSSPDAVAVEKPPALPVRGMPAFTLRCDGRGTCCRLYPTTVFSPAEVTTALHYEGGGVTEHERFTPERGSELVPWRGRSVLMVDGRCHHLEGDGRCRLHAAAGPRAKPGGCRRYPAQLVRDGREVRVGVAPECACVLDSACEGDGNAPPLTEAPVLEPWPRDSRELDDAVFVADLPDSVMVRDGEALSRDRFVTWCDESAEAFGSFRGDPARWLWAQAARLTARPCDPDGPPEHREIERRRARLVEELERRARLSTWRSESDLAFAMPRWLTSALDGTAEELIGAPCRGPGEPFFVRALLFVHDPALSAATVVEALRRSAMQIWIARRLGRVLAEDDHARDDPATRHPLALVAGYARAFSL